MPARGASCGRIESALLARLAHSAIHFATNDELSIGSCGSDLASDPAGDVSANVREMRRDYDRSRKLPASLVEELSRTEVLGQQAWAEAHKRSEYTLFLPWLEKILGLKGRKRIVLVIVSDPYDALLDQFEPGATAQSVRLTFESLRGPLVKLIRGIGGSPRKAPDRNPGTDTIRRPRQECLAREAAAAIGFDFSAGRLDVSVHPFCSGLGPGDTRLTTRYDENYFGDAFFGVLHEAGHGMYEQGLCRGALRHPARQAASLGIHESQSRMWENLVGRSRAFWRFFLPKTREAFPQSLGGATKSAMSSGTSRSTMCGRHSFARNPTKPPTTCMCSCALNWSGRCFGRTSHRRTCPAPGTEDAGLPGLTPAR